jgi:rhodanese-related sulfurtransferase
MTHVIRQALVILPLGLVLSGCAGPQQSQSSFNQAARPSARATGATVADRSGSRSNETIAPRRSEPVAESSTAEAQHYITLEQFRRYAKTQGTVVIDARSTEAFASGHVNGAISLPAGEIEAHMAPISNSVASSQLIIVYCASSSCGASDMVSEYLANHGYTNVHVFSPGWVALASAGSMQ